MSKRILAFICTLAILVGLFPVISLAETANTPDTYLVGYAKRDINPWVDPKDHSQGILPVYLTGNGNDSERVCTGIFDDNGDNSTGEGDGVFTTCTAVTDANGTTVLYVTLDTLQGETTAVADIRNRIMKDLKDAEGNAVVNGNQIMISGSHTHSAPNLLKVKQDYKSTYYEYILSQVSAAVQEAYNDRTAATMKRGSVDAKVATKALYPESGEGYQMNFLRHYQITAKYSAWGGLITDTKSYVVGSAFSAGGTTVGKSSALSDYEVIAADHVAEADNTMHLLQFEFDEKTGKSPVIMLNWRAHPTTNSGDAPTLVSSDYVGALRYYLEQKGYRGVFLQGAGANTVISSRYHTDWTELCPTPGTANTNTYGELLANVAEYCLNNNMSENLACGDIRIIQRTFTGELQEPEEGLLAIANSVTENTSYPFTAKYTDGKSYTLNSVYHAEQVIARSKQKGNQDYVTQEIAVVSLGGVAAFVTAPNELSDRYGIDSYTDTQNELWATLINEETYGTPFVITHANGMKGYLPNEFNYHYNEGVKDRKGNALPLAAGSYEANTSHYKAGTGEELIIAFDEMLAELDQEEETRYCEACDDDVVWKPVSYLQDKDQYLGSGHYYYAAAPLSSVQRTVRAGEKLCLDLNGYTVTTKGRSYLVEVGGVLNVLDRQGTGAIVSTTASGSNSLYGTFHIKGEMNIYGGSFRFDDEGTPSVDMGGVFGVTDGGTLYLYGGEITGTNLLNTGKYGDSGKGAAILVYNGQLYIGNDAKVISGTIPEEGGAGPCIALRNLATNKVCLSGNASVDDIYFDTTNYKNLTISDTFSGNVGLSYASNVALSTGMTIGNAADNADVSNATFRFSESSTNWRVYVEGNYLKIKGYNPSTVAVIGETEYPSLQDAIDAPASDNAVIKLVKKEASIETAVDKNACLDLNGFDVTGELVVKPGYTLYCMDSQTDDYTVNDEAGYGKLTNVSGSVEGIPEESKLAEDGYLKVVEDNEVENNKEVSFHRVNLQLTHMTLRAVTDDVCAPSVYYKCKFMGDEMVKAAVESKDCGYGIALSVQEMPDADNLEDKCEYTRFTTFTSGAAGNAGNGTLLYGIMKPTNKALINSRNANMAIYGRAYIQTADGYMFGAGYSPSLKRVTEAADAMLSDPTVSDAAKENIMENLLRMYNAYSSVMRSWNLPNLKNTNKNDGALKVLVIGNSHGLDATNLLYEVFKDQDYTEQNLVLGALYKAGCTMKEHADYMTNSKPNYDYYENDGSNADGSWTVTKDTVADTALNAHQWDIIILQQMNNWAACSTYQKTEFTTVINYVKNHQVGNSRFGWHMVWTNPDQEEYLTDSSSLSHPDNAAWVNYHVRNFPSASDNTKYDQSVMYQNMVKYTKTYIEGDKSFLGSDVFDFVIPSCTAIEYAQDGLGYTQAQVYRDYTHMSDYGRLMVAYLWYAKILGKTSISNVGIFEIPSALHHAHSAYPSDLQITAEMRNDIKTAVNYALANPYELP